MQGKMNEVIAKPGKTPNRAQDLKAPNLSSKQDRSHEVILRTADKAALKDILGNFSEQTGAIFD